MPSLQRTFKFGSSQGTEFITTTDNVTAVSVETVVEAMKERKHLSRVSTATEDNEKARRLTFRAWKGFGRMDCWKDIEKTKLKGVNDQFKASQSLNMIGLTNAEESVIIIHAST